MTTAMGILFTLDCFRRFRNSRLELTSPGQTVLRPSHPMPKAAIMWRSLKRVPSISTVHSGSSPNGRSSNWSIFSRLASMKFSRRLVDPITLW
jgi:hypothetical protein